MSASFTSQFRIASYYDVPAWFVQGTGEYTEILHGGDVRSADFLALIFLGSTCLCIVFPQSAYNHTKENQNEILLTKL
jgi:hypothetical protein